MRCSARCTLRADALLERTGFTRGELQRAFGLAAIAAVAAAAVGGSDREPRRRGAVAASAFMDRSFNESSLNLDQRTEDTLEFAGIVVWTVGWIVAVHDTNRGVSSA